MGRGIYKQPNGRYAVFSSIVDHFIFYDATEQELIDFFLQEEKEEIERRIHKTVSELDEDEEKSAKAWKEKVTFIKRLHGRNDSSLLEILEAINQSGSSDNP